MSQKLSMMADLLKCSLDSPAEDIASGPQKDSAPCPKSDRFSPRGQGALSQYTYFSSW